MPTNKNVIYYIKLKGKDFFDYTIPSLKQYCEINNIDLKEWNEENFKKKYEIYNKKNGFSIFLQKFAIIEDFLESTYEKLCMVDLDMIFNKNAPNIFDEIKEDKIYQVPIHFEKNKPSEIKNKGMEVGNGGLYLMKKNEARNIVNELQPKKLKKQYHDQGNFALARKRAGIDFGYLNETWNFPWLKVIKGYNNYKNVKPDDINIIHYNIGKNKGKKIKEHYQLDKFANFFKK